MGPLITQLYGSARLIPFGKIRIQYPNYGGNKNWARVRPGPWALALGQGPARSLGPGPDQGPARSLGPGPDQGPAWSMGPGRAQALAHVGFIGIHFWENSQNWSLRMARIDPD